MIQSLADIHRLLRRGFYLDNFIEIVRLALDAARASDHPLPLFVIARILWGLNSYWRDRPLTVTTAERMKDALLPALEDYLVAAQDGLSPELEVKYLDEIVAAYLRWDVVQRTIPHGE